MSATECYKSVRDEVPSPEEKREAARTLARGPSRKKSESAKLRAQRVPMPKGGGVKPWPILQIPCKCGLGSDLSRLHPTTCPRGRGQRRQLLRIGTAANSPVMQQIEQRERSEREKRRELFHEPTGRE